MFPTIEPYETGLLEVTDGQHLHWEVCGSPSGIPAVVLHGGPGAGCSPGARRLFDPAAYRIVLFDQRGCGHSRPRVGVTTDLSANTTQHLIADMERLRMHLGVERWILQGTSWGVTLALAYAERHPERVIAMVLASVTMTRPIDIHWLYHEVGRYFPEEWRRFRDGVPEPDRDGDLVSAYHRLLNEQPDTERRERAARDWCDWEEAVSPLPGGIPNPRYEDPSFRMTFARIVTHYFHHGAWLRQDQLLHEAHRLEGIPGALIHGRLDLGAPVDAAWQLAQVWSGADLRVVETGHAGGPEMAAAITEATNRFAELC